MTVSAPRWHVDVLADDRLDEAAAVYRGEPVRFARLPDDWQAFLDSGACMDRPSQIYGVWDHDGFYDLETDPHERHNLINVPSYQQQIARMKTQLFDELDASGGLNVPVRRPAGERLDQRKLTR